MAYGINPLNAELNPFCHLLALLGAHHILHVSRIRVKFGKIMGMNESTFIHNNSINPYPANVENMVSSLWQQMADGI
jgi:hypothetical protein